jgi:hypothetical protein
LETRPLSSSETFRQKQQKISRVVLVKHFNPLFLGEQVAGGITQSDFVGLYSYALAEELRIENIELVEADDVAEGCDDDVEVPPFSLVLILSVGWAAKPGEKNATQTFYTQPNSRELAEELMTAIGDWGRCWNFEHYTVKPKKIDAGNSLFSRDETKAVAIEPFAANGLGVDAYIRRSRELGQVIGKTVSEHLKTRGQAITHVPLHIM